MADDTNVQLDQALQNAVAAQQQGWTIIQAATTQGVNLIYSLDATTPAQAQQAQNVAAAKAELAAATPDSADAPAQSNPITDALLSLNTVIMREAIFTIEAAAVAMAVRQVNEAATAEALALATQRLEAILREFASWSRSV